MLSRTIIKRTNKCIKILVDIVPNYNLARKNAMATLIVNIERLNNPDFPYDWFRSRCIDKTNILKLPDESFVMYAVMASDYLTKIQREPIDILIDISKERSTARVNLIKCICNIDGSREIEKEKHNICALPNDELKWRLLVKGVDMNKISNRNDLLNTVFIVYPPPKYDMDKAMIHAETKYSYKSDKSLIEFVNGLIVKDESQLLIEDIKILKRNMNRVNSRRVVIMDYLKEYWNNIPVHLLNGKTYDQLNDMSDAKFYEIVKAFRSFQQLHPDGSTGTPNGKVR